MSGYTLLHGAETDSQELMPDSQEVCSQYSAVSWHPQPMSQGQSSHCVKGEKIWRNRGFFWGTENAAFPAALVHSHLMNTSLKTVQPSDCASGASLARFVLLL